MIKLKFLGPGYEQWIGRRVRKRSVRPFKSGQRSNTVKGIIEHPILKGKPAFTFNEDDSFVGCDVCRLVEGTLQCN